MQECASNEGLEVPTISLDHFEAALKDLQPSVKAGVRFSYEISLRLHFEHQ